MSMILLCYGSLGAAAFGVIVSSVLSCCWDCLLLYTICRIYSWTYLESVHIYTISSLVPEQNRSKLKY